MSRKSQKILDEENAVLVREIFNQAILDRVSPEDLWGKLPKGFLGKIYEDLPDKLRNTWKEESMAGVWKQRKAELIPKIKDAFVRLNNPPKTPHQEDVNYVKDVEEEQAVEDAHEQEAPAQPEKVVEVVKEETRELPSESGPTPEELQRYLDRLEEKLTALEDVKSELTTLVQEEVRAVIGQVQPAPTSTPADIEEPPVPPKDGKKQKGDKKIINVRVDKNLQALFLEDVARAGGNASRAMDKILWNFYGKPRLSFETEKSDKPQGSLELDEK